MTTATGDESARSLDSDGAAFAQRSAQPASTGLLAPGEQHLDLARGKIAGDLEDEVAVTSSAPVTDADPPLGHGREDALNCGGRSQSSKMNLLVGLTAQLLNLPVTFLNQLDVHRSGAKRRNLDPPPRATRQLRRLAEYEVKCLINAYLDGTTGRELAERFNVNESTAYAILKRNGVARRPYRKVHGEKLTELSSMRGEGMTLVAIATAAGLNRKTVSDALRQE